MLRYHIIQNVPQVLVLFSLSVVCFLNRAFSKHQLGPSHVLFHSMQFCSRGRQGLVLVMATTAIWQMACPELIELAVTILSNDSWHLPQYWLVCSILGWNDWWSYRHTSPHWHGQKNIWGEAQWKVYTQEDSSFFPLLRVIPRARFRVGLNPAGFSTTCPRLASMRVGQKWCCKYRNLHNWISSQGIWQCLKVRTLTMQHWLRCHNNCSCFQTAKGTSSYFPKQLWILLTNAAVKANFDLWPIT